ncbi:MAG: laccase domain-containing protein [Bacilli bacterium]|nr:laccase domain-containing protein [Bacilli bacterium]
MKDLFITYPLSEKCLAITTTTTLGNMAYQVDDGKDVKEHRLLLAESLNIPFDKFTYVHQHHSDIIKKVTLDDIGRGKDSFIDGLECDALYTDIKGVPLCIFHADCVPIFFVNENANIVGIIHAGFKGTMKHIAYKAMKEVMEKENLKPEGFKFYIGPFRMKRSFQVDYVSKMEIIDCNQNRALKGQYFDNGLANILDLRELGFKDEQIECINIDTVTDDNFYSAYQKTPIGRMVSLIVLK